jgi:diguanylate cyclase (GGDEF)-like protein/PAS domain S-box-containing protein
MVVRAFSGGNSDDLVVGGTAIVLFGLVVARMMGLARDQAAVADRERTMRRAASALVAATTPAEIVSAAQEAAGVLAGVDAQPLVLRVKRRNGDDWLVGADPQGGGELRLALVALPEGVADRLGRREPVDMGRAEAAVLCPGLGATPLFAAPILAEGELAGAVALMNATAISRATRRSLETLAGQVGLALESAALTSSRLRTESEARLSTLVQHSTDVILVIAADMTVQYASPSVHRILGYDAADFVRRPLLDYIAEADRALFRPGFAALLASMPETSEGFEFLVRHCDGRLLHAECLMTNLLENPVVGGVVVNLRDITERKQFEAQLTYQALHDPVTDLANRALFRDRVEHAFSRRRDGHSMLAVLFLDLDDFKTINDTFGHDAGDRMLQLISARLQSALRAGDTVARLGGDEFAILLEDIADETAVSGIVEGVLEAIRAPLLLDEREATVQCSIGIAIAGPPSASEAVTTVDELLRNADVAMYQAKADDGNTYRHFKHEMHEAVVEQIAAHRSQGGCRR